MESDIGRPALLAMFNVIVSPLFSASQLIFYFKLRKRMNESANITTIPLSIC